ncbi:hypothetical protein ACWGH3_09035 [Streptomyces sp. NPDC054884]|uniref:hypothetical protein n=1 Tax=Streptomyces sp. ME08-AFT2 TaxID=3028683 RepID=UPI0029A83C05|nr:hypothetical protein [Streptomyces sp. ME08-AFT2]MDX3309000.1 hypothetical protein [Streptomyces sp. ME08-AFT2]
MTAPSSERSGRDLRLLRAAVFAAVCVVLAAAGHTMASCAAVPLWTLGAGFLAALAVVAPLAGRSRSLPGIVALLAVGQTVLHTLFGIGQHTASVSATASTSVSGAVSSVSSASASASAALSASDASLVERAARLVCGATAAPLSPAQALKMLVDARLYSPGDGTVGGTGSGGTAMHGMNGMSGTGGTGSMQHAGDALASAGSTLSLLPSLPMLLGHVLAAVAAGWLLRRGDTALVRLLALSAHGVAEGALVRSLRGALALVRALLAGLPTTPGTEVRVPRTALLTPDSPRTVALQHSVIRRGPPDVSVLGLAA